MHRIYPSPPPYKKRSYSRKAASPFPNGEPSDEQWAMLAGFISGEGCLLTHIHSQDGYVTTKVTITQKYQEPLDQICSIFGGRVKKQKRQSGRFSPLERYLWIVSSRAEVERLLRGIYPHLICKKKQAALIINLMNQPRDVQHRIHYRLKELKKTCA